VLFITVHQVFELWFKLILRELRTARDLFTAKHVAEQELSGAVRSLGRATAVLRVSFGHWEVMETMTTREFLAFREKLIPASGFQSAQLRQIEILMGLAESDRIGMGPAGGEAGYLAALKAAHGGASPAFDRVKAQLEDGPSLKDAIHSWLWRTPIDGCDPQHPQAEQRLDAFLENFLAAHARETDSGCEHAIALADTDAERQALRMRYETEKKSVRDFFSPSEAEGGARRRRIRAAMLFIETYRELRSSSRRTASCRSWRGRAKCSTAWSCSSSSSSSSASDTRAWSSA
jgi:tryptophan 2,3-dioxygenase